jgi:phosphatidylserine decarboxylase
MVAGFVSGRLFLEGRRYPFVAREGIPFLVAAAAGFALALRYLDVFAAVAAAGLFCLLALVFRDPRRVVPASPLGIVSPVDGRVIGIDLADRGVVQGEAHRVHIHINSLGSYTVRSPVEGQIKDLRSIAPERVGEYRTNALWVQTDEGDDVVVQFRGYRLGLPPRSFIGFGQRVGQGQRCAYLRLTRFAEVHLPVETKILVKPGDVLVAGTDLIGKFTHS